MSAQGQIEVACANTKGIEVACLLEPGGINVAVRVINGEGSPVSSSIQIDVSGSGTTRTIDISVGGSARYFLDMWLVDDSDYPNDITLTPPSGSDIVQWSKVTDATGAYSMDITHTGAAQTWYLVVVLGAQVAISDAIAFT